MSSARNSSAAARLVIAYLEAHGGTAPAGDVTAHAAAAGHAPSTIRRVAGGIVTKSRQGNAFIWSIEHAQTPTVTAPEARPPAPAEHAQISSIYAALSQAERLHLIAQRPTLQASDFHELTDIEAIVVLEGDDEGLYDLPGITNGAPGALPY